MGRIKARTPLEIYWRHPGETCPPVKYRYFSETPLGSNKHRKLKSLQHLQPPAGRSSSGWGHYDLVEKWGMSSGFTFCRCSSLAVKQFLFQFLKTLLTTKIDQFIFCYKIRWAKVPLSRGCTWVRDWLAKIFHDESDSRHPFIWRED